MDTPLLEPRSQAKEKAVGFIEAWRIPGVAPFALCLFFCKLVAYTFLYWLPFYISHTGSSEFCFCSYYALFSFLYLLASNMTHGATGMHSATMHGAL
jgi:hypothetical protein